MIDFSATRVSKLASTWVGCKSRYESFMVPRMTCVPVNDIAEELIIGTFQKTFEKASEFWYLSEGEDNSAYRTLRSTFSDPDVLLPAGAAYLTEDLYNSCEDPRIQGGEFFTIYFEDLMVNGEPCNAIGLWKIEGHTPFFKTERTSEMNLLATADGFATSKPQVVALVLNLDETEGYQVCAVDTVSKRNERSFWKDSFLKLRPIEDEYFQTRHAMTLTAEFITQKAGIKFGLDRVGTLSLLVKAGDYFKDNDEFEALSFANYLFDMDEEKMTAYLEFREAYASAYAIPISDIFTLNSAAVKKESKQFKAGIKLDKNFSLSINGRPDLIERGFDEATGQKWYKIFFEWEE